MSTSAAAPVIGGKYHVEIEVTELLGDDSIAPCQAEEAGLIDMGSGTAIIGIAKSDQEIAGLVRVHIRNEVIELETSGGKKFCNDTVKIISAEIKLYPINY